MRYKRGHLSFSESRTIALKLNVIIAFLYPGSTEYVCTMGEVLLLLAAIKSPGQSAHPLYGIALLLYILAAILWHNIVLHFYYIINGLAFRMFISYRSYLL